MPRRKLAACAMVCAFAELIIAKAAFATVEPTFEPVEQTKKRRMRRSIPRKEKEEKKRLKEATKADEAKRRFAARVLHL